MNTSLVAWERPWLLGVAALVAVGAVLAVLAWQRRRASRLGALGSASALARLAPAAGSRAALHRAIRLGVAAVLAAVALAGPRFGAARELIRTKGSDVVIAMDASLSMLAEDERPSRLARLKQEVRRFRAASPGDRIALVAFAGRAYVLSPLTGDDGAIELFLDNLDPSVVGQPGTALAPALTTSLELLKAAQGGAGQAIVLLSDGEGFDDKTEALKAAKQAAAANVRLVTVGFGTEGGAPITLRKENLTTQHRDWDGNVVITKYDPTMLSELATAAEGEFVPSDATDKGSRIARALASLEAKARAADAGLQMPARYQWFLGLAVLLLFYDAWRADGGRLRRFWKRGAIALTMIALPRSGQAQAPADRALELFKAGRTPEAVRAYREAISRGDRTPRTLYNFGTVLLAADSLDGAVDALERAAFGAAPALRERALFNLGLAQLRRAKANGDPQERMSNVRGALGAYRELLLANPQHADARWNYELALRLRQNPPPQQGGGQNDKQNQPPQKDQSEMNRQQAEQLLDAAARDEHDTQSRKRRPPSRDRAPGGKDW